MSENTMILYRLSEVPDPDGTLTDCLADLIDNSALIEVRAKRAPGEALLVDEYYWVLVEDTTDE